MDPVAWQATVHGVARVRHDSTVHGVARIRRDLATRREREREIKRERERAPEPLQSIGSQRVGHD